MAIARGSAMLKAIVVRRHLFLVESGIWRDIVVKWHLILSKSALCIICIENNCSLTLIEKHRLYI